MIKVPKLALAVPLSAALLWGCSSAEDPYAPVEAPEIRNQFEPQRLFSASIGSGVGEFFTTLAPEFASGTLFAASRDGDVYAKDPNDGDTLWHTDISDEEENDSSRSVRLSGGMAAYAGKVAVGSENGYLYMLNAMDGAILWKEYLGSEILVKPAFSKSGDKVFVTDARGRVRAYDAASGGQLWVSGDAPNVLRLRKQSGLVPVGDDFLVAGQSNGKISVLLQQTGAIVNQITAAPIRGANALERISDVAATPVLRDHDMYATTYSGGLIHYSFDAMAVLNRLGYNSAEELACDDTSLVVTTQNSHVFCINLSDYSERWANDQLSYRNVTAPVIYGNYVVVGDYEGYLYFMSLSTGRIECMEHVDGSGIYAAPLVANGNLYVVSRDGDLYCYKYDPTGLAFAKESAARTAQDYAMIGVDMRAPGVGDSGIYVTEGMTEEQLYERRAAVLRAAAQAEARQRAAEAQRREYERRRAEYEQRMQEERERLSGFGLMPGLQGYDDEDEQEAEDNSASQTPAPAAPREDDADAAEKAAGFGL